MTFGKMGCIQSVRVQQQAVRLYNKRKRDNDKT